MRDRGVGHRAEGEAEFPATPERELWIAVIERALKDYCFFFDRILHAGGGQVLRYEDLKAFQKNTFSIKAIAEFNRLIWFLFATAAEPFNLQYLCDHLYDDGHSMCDYIREETQRQFKLHFLEQEQKDRFVAVMNFIRETTNVASLAPAEMVSTLRYKRYRNQPYRRDKKPSLK